MNFAAAVKTPRPKAMDLGWKQLLMDDEKGGKPQPKPENLVEYNKAIRSVSIKPIPRKPNETEADLALKVINLMKENTPVKASEIQKLLQDGDASFARRQIEGRDVRKWDPVVVTFKDV